MADQSLAEGTPAAKRNRSECAAESPGLLPCGPMDASRDCSPAAHPATESTLDDVAKLQMAERVFPPTLGSFEEAIAVPGAREALLKSFDQGSRQQLETITVDLGERLWGKPASQLLGFAAALWDACTAARRPKVELSPLPDTLYLHEYTAADTRHPSETSGALRFISKPPQKTPPGKVFEPEFSPVDGARVQYGSLVLGPSGSGKSTYMHHAIPSNIHLRRRVPVKVVKFAMEAAAFFALCPTTKNADVDNKMRARALAADFERQLGHFDLPREPLCVLVIVDEVGVRPGYFSNPAYFKDIVDAVLDTKHLNSLAGRRTCPHRDCAKRQAFQDAESMRRHFLSSHFDTASDEVDDFVATCHAHPDTVASLATVAGVHVAVGGTAAEVGGLSLASNLDHVRKLRLEPWTHKTLSEACPAVVASVFYAQPVVRVAVTNPRMASCASERCRGTKPTESERLSFCASLVEDYRRMNGLKMFNDADFREVRKGVAACAFLAVMSQRHSLLDEPSDLKEYQLQAPGPDLSILARARIYAVHFGLITYTVTSRQDGNTTTLNVDKGTLPYTMSPALVLVALSLLGVSLDAFATDWAAFERQCATCEAVALAVRSLQFDEVNEADMEPFPAALQLLRSQPRVRSRVDVCLLESAAPDVYDRGEHDECTRFVLALPCEPCAFLQAPMAESFDGASHRLVFQSKFTVKTELAYVVDVNAELEKAGLLKSSSVAAKALIRLLHRRWASHEENSDFEWLKGNSACLGPTVGEWLMYPFGEMTKEWLCAPRGFVETCIDYDATGVFSKVMPHAATEDPVNDCTSRTKVRRSAGSLPDAASLADNFVEFRLYLSASSIRLRVGRTLLGVMPKATSSRAQDRCLTSRILAIVTKTDAAWTLAFRGSGADLEGQVFDALKGLCDIMDDTLPFESVHVTVTCAVCHDRSGGSPQNPPAATGASLGA